MAKTRDDLIRRVLEKLMILSVGQPVSSEDRAQIDGAIDPLLSDLQAREVFYVADADAIDEAAYEHLATILALRIGDSFGVTSVGGIPVTPAGIKQAEEPLRVIARIGNGDDAPLRAPRGLLYRNRRRW